LRGGLGRGSKRVHAQQIVLGQFVYPRHHPSLTLPLKARGPEV
jgi:hypothetical protein